MAVQVATLDILTERAHFDSEVARAMGDAIDMELKTSRETLAVKREISHLKQEIKAFRYEVKQDLKDLELSLSQQFAKGADEIKRRMLVMTLTMMLFMFVFTCCMMQHVH